MVTRLGRYTLMSSCKQCCLKLHLLTLLCLGNSGFFLMQVYCFVRLFNCFSSILLLQFCFCLFKCVLSSGCDSFIVINEQVLYISFNSFRKFKCGVKWKRVFGSENSPFLTSLISSLWLFGKITFVSLMSHKSVLADQS